MRSVSFSVIQYPTQKGVISHAAVCNGKAHVYKLIVRALDRYAVHLQERQHHVDPDPLVPVNERVIGDQGIAEPGPFFFFCWVKLLFPKAGICAFKGRI